MIGKTILHYKILKKLGEGGMGVVYKARDTKLDRDVAIKFLPPHIAGDSEARERFVNEAKAAAALNHPNIAQIYAIETAGDAQFIVMEFIDGKELRKEVGSSKLEVARCLNIAIQVAKGLQTAHEKGIIHRDIKPSNIILTPGGQVKIMDFGLAKMADSSLQTRQGTTLGTVAYMSPEQVQAMPADHRTDIWSLGVVMYEMLAGKKPFEGDYEQMLVYAILNETPEKLSAHRKDAPAEMDAFVEKALAKNPDDRFPDMTAVIAALQAMHPGSGVAAVPKPGAAEDARGEQIGPYKIRQLLGEGGMGEVYLAEQTEPVRRKVALKIIKAGMDSKRIIARFEAERQALAVMDHPNIAKVFEAGTTDRGRPYFVMEYVAGVPLNEYCDTHKLSTNERLTLFVAICNAVQHAHQKGVIHRDLKPSNILVTLQDGKATPKIIDFGIAKAVHTPLTERTLVTAIGEVVGTPAYMSPEQLENSQLDIDTRADIYSLGVILYELLAGILPFDLSEYRKDSGSLQKLLRDSDPPTPSKRLQTLGDVSEKIARNRRTDAGSLRKKLQGDLDWITIKAMEKDRSRRYETASGLAMDIDRYLSNEPVAARPPSAGYRIGKFVRRNKLAVFAAGIAFAGLLIGLIFATVGFVRATQAEQKAAREAESARQVADFLVDLFKISDPSETQGDTISVRTFLDRSAARIDRELRAEPVIQGRLMQTMGQVYANLGAFQKGIALLDSARIRQETNLGNQHPELAKTLWRLGYAWYETGENETALNYLRRAGSIYRHNGDEMGELLTLNSLADVWDQMAQYDTAMAYAQKAAAIADRHTSSDDVSVPRAYLRVAKVLMHQGNYAEAVNLARKGLQQILRHHSEYHPVSQEIMNDLAVVLDNANQYEEALSLNRKVVEIAEKLWGKEHWQTAISYDNLANVLVKVKQYDEALDYQHRAEAVLRKLYGDDHVDVAVNLNNQAYTHLNSGDYTAAEPPIREANRIMIQNFGENHPYPGITFYTLAGVLMKQGRLAEAEAICKKSVAILGETLGEDHPRYALSLRQLGDISAQLRKYDVAEKHFRAAIAVFEKGEPVDSVALATTQANYIDLLRNTNRHAEADSIERLFPKNSP